jgi:hypothetical protein
MAGVENGERELSVLRSRVCGARLKRVELEKEVLQGKKDKLKALEELRASQEQLQECLK